MSEEIEELKNKFERKFSSKITPGTAVQEYYLELNGRFQEAIFLIEGREVLEEVYNLLEEEAILRALEGLGANVVFESFGDYDSEKYYFLKHLAYEGEAVKTVPAYFIGGKYVVFEEVQNCTSENCGCNSHPRFILQKITLRRE